MVFNRTVSPRISESTLAPNARSSGSLRGMGIPLRSPRRDDPRPASLLRAVTAKALREADREVVRTRRRADRMSDFGGKAEIEGSVDLTDYDAFDPNRT